MLARTQRTCRASTRQDRDFRTRIGARDVAGTAGSPHGVASSHESPTRARFSARPRLRRVGVRAVSFISQTVEVEDLDFAVRHAHVPSGLE